MSRSRAAVRAYYRNLQQLLSNQGIRMRATHLGTRAEHNGDDWIHDAWRCTFKKPGNDGSLTFEYRMGVGHEGRTPIAEEVLEGLLSDILGVDQSFSDWCADYGLNADSRRAEQTFTACVKQREQMQNYFGETLLRNMQAALDRDNDTP